MPSHQPHSPDTHAFVHHIHSVHGACCFLILPHVLGSSCSASHTVCWSCVILYTQLHLSSSCIVCQCIMPMPVLIVVSMMQQLASAFLPLISVAFHITVLGHPGVVMPLFHTWCGESSRPVQLQGKRHRTSVCRFCCGNIFNYFIVDKKFNLRIENENCG